MTLRLNIRAAMRGGRRLAHVCAGLCLPLFVTVGGLAGYRVNLTPSEPLGIWRIKSLERPPAVGDVIFICPPRRPDMELAAQRGYFRSGICLGSYAPLIKTVAAVEGQRVEIEREVKIDDAILAHSVIAGTDGKGLPLTPYSGGLVPAGSVYVHSDFPGSYDSRYFGPLPINGVLGLAQEVFTFAP